MSIYISNFVFRNTSISNCHFKTKCLSFAVWRSNVSSVSICSKSCNFTIDFCTTFYSVFQIFQNQSSSTFTNYQTISVFVKTFRCFFRSIIQTRSCTQSIKNCSIWCRKFFRSTTNHNILTTISNSFITITNTLATRSTSSISNNHTTTNLIVNRKVTSRSLRHSLNISLRIQVRRITSFNHFCQIANSIHTSHTSSVRNTSTTIF